MGITQQLLYAALGDVLLVLDCCNAALIKGGEKPQGKFELLAASAKGVKTPLPGRTSYTSLLIKKLRKHVDKGITARGLNHLLMTDSRITETPIHTDFAQNVPTSITLQRLRVPQHQGFIPKPSSVVMFRASLTGDPTGIQIAQWLKTCPPKNVTAVDIEAVVLKARKLQGLVDENAFPPTSMFRKLSPPAQQEIFRQLQGLNSVVSASSSCAQNQTMVSNSEGIEAHHDQIQAQVSAVCTAIETPILLEMNPTDLKDASNDEEVIIAEAAEAVCLRQYLLDTKAIPNNLEVPYSELKVPEKKSRMRMGSIKDKTVLVEFFEYFPDPYSGEPYKETVQQLQKMCNLLCQPKRTSFHILPCVGYVHDRVSLNFGLVFEPPQGHDAAAPSIKMSDLYQRYRLVPLGHRVRLASALVVALENFHRVGWVHKALRPDNIFFSPSQPASASASDANISREPVALVETIDLALPYLFGFEYARAEAAGTRLDEDHVLKNNLYRHPDRWSRPTEKYIKAHDVYALGIMLYEIALWKNISSDLRRDPRIPRQVRDHIQEKCKEKLPHQVGQTFADTIMACLDFKQSTEGMNEYEMQRFFQVQVKERLEKAVGKI
ncbi:hypothetical protein AOQ84DRAFT_443881 [Glonium stellatum]|uniref:Protein kinase domain-containing protein n=1 Tax=Glonium stellatum TaxID=574774 RepID=A0A8E2JLC9_9PEZI|nr:hypothetical protein AOQ84DRAFT_443881 [Glonium stellatum]